MLYPPALAWDADRVCWYELFGDGGEYAGGAEGVNGVLSFCMLSSKTGSTRLLADVDGGEKAK